MCSAREQKFSEVSKIFLRSLTIYLFVITILFLVEMSNMKSLSRIKYMYRGLLPPTFNRCLGRMFTFGGYDSCRRVLSKNSHFKGQKLNFLAALGSGAFEGKIGPKLRFPRAFKIFNG